MGRPPLPKGEAKKTLLVIRFTPAFYKALCVAAKKAGKCLTHYIRDALQEKLDQDQGVEDHGEHRQGPERHT